MKNYSDETIREMLQVCEEVRGPFRAYDDDVERMGTQLLKEVLVARKVVSAAARTLLEDDPETRERLKEALLVYETTMDWENTVNELA
jgi:predicted regulator of amino acid metabolism with ACT domain